MKNYFKESVKIERNRLGRPKFYDTPEKLMKRTLEYFDACYPEDENGQVTVGERPTMFGLQIWLGFSSRSTFLNYRKDEKFVEIIEMARCAIGQYYESELLGKNAQGAKFALSAMFGVNEKSEQIVTEVTKMIDMTGVEKSLEQRDESERMLALED